MGNNETTPLRPDSLLGKFTKPSESRVTETTGLFATGTVVSVIQAPRCGVTVCRTHLRLDAQWVFLLLRKLWMSSGHLANS